MMLVKKMEVAASVSRLSVLPLPDVLQMFNFCAAAMWKRPQFYKDSFFSNKGPRFKMSRRMRNRERSLFRAFKNDK